MHAACQIAYHFVWIPQYRRKALTGLVAKRLVDLLCAKRKALGGTILTVAVPPNHGHLSCSFAPSLAPDQIMYRLKGLKAHELRKEFPDLKTRAPNKWTRASFVGMAGPVSAATFQTDIKA